MNVYYCNDATHFSITNIERSIRTGELIWEGISIRKKQFSMLYYYQSINPIDFNLIERANDINFRKDNE